MPEIPNAESTQTVTIRLDSNFQNKGPCWVSRDDRGTWHCYCLEKYSTTAAGAAAAMYHPGDIMSVVGNTDGKTATVKLIDYFPGTP